MTLLDRALAILDDVDHADVRSLVARIRYGDRWDRLGVDLSELEPRVNADVIHRLDVLRAALEAERAVRLAEKRLDAYIWQRHMGTSATAEETP